MIIYEKLLERYSLNELKKIFSTYDFYYNIYENRINKLEVITKSIDIKEFYKFEDFEKDFKEKYKKYTEKRTIYNILMSGISVADFLKLNKVILNQLYKGFIMESISFSKEQLPYISIDYDISNLEVIFFEKHIELYGKKEDLESFKTKFKIEQKILKEPYKNSWHLAFKGLLAEKIRYDFENKK